MAVLVPYLARVAAEADLSATRRDAVDVVYQSFKRYLGVAVGEHLGYLLTGMWSVLVGIARRHLTPIAYIAWSLWLVVTGVTLLA